MLQIKLFGGFEANHNKTLCQFPTKKSQSLLALLALNLDRGLSRCELAHTLWPDLDERKGKCCISSELWRIRQTLSAVSLQAQDIIEADSEKIRLVKSNIWLDSQQFMAHYQQFITQDKCPASPLDDNSYEHLQTCMALYQGELLYGFHEEWCWMERESLRVNLNHILQRLLNHYKVIKAWQQVIVYGKQLLAFDPLMEEVHREIIYAYLQTGSRLKAIQQFEQLAQRLQEELGISPAQETLALFRSISTNTINEQYRGSPPPVTSNKSQGGNTNLKIALEHLCSAESLIKTIQHETALTGSGG